MKDLTKGNPFTLILYFALPLALGNVLQLCYSLIDTRIVGENLGDEALCAVGATTALSNFLISFLSGMGNGFALIAARFFGAKDEKSLRKSVSSLYGMTGLIALAFSLLSVVLLPVLLSLMKVPEGRMAEATAYIRIVLLGLVFTAYYNALSGLLRAVGDTVRPLVFLAFSAGLNVVLDLLLVKGIKLGVAGAALATLIAQAVSVVLCLWYIKKRYPLLSVSLKTLKIDPAMAKMMAGSGFSMGFMISLVNFGTLALQSAINALGDSIIVAHMAARKLTEIFMLPFGVLGMTMGTWCSQNLGAGKPERIREGIKTALLMGSVFLMLVVLCSYTIVPQLVRAITHTSDPVVVENATRYLRFDTLFYVITMHISVFRNAMQGFGDHVTPVVSSAVELVGKVLAASFLAPALGYFGIILTEPIVWALMVIPLCVQIFRADKKDFSLA